MVECLSESGQLAVAVTATSRRVTDRCGGPGTILPAQDDCPAVLSLYGQLCRPSTGPLAGTDGAILSWIEPHRVVLDDGGDVASSDSDLVWLARCMDDGELEVNLIETPVTIDREAPDRAHVEIGTDFSDIQASYDATYCALD